MGSGPPENFGLNSRYDNFEEVLFGNLLRAADVVHQRIAERLKKEDITLAQYNVLRTVRARDRGQGISILNIAEDMIHREPDMTRLLDRMDRAGFIKRRRSAEDGRVVLVSLTRKGDALAVRLEMPLVRHHRRVFGAMNREDQEKLNQLLFRARTGATEN